jgi:hypothetical protein
MMKRGIIVFDHEEQEWRLWIGQQPYWLQQGDSFELRIQSNYFLAYLEKDFDWFITLEKKVRLVLHMHEVYKVRVDLQDYMKVDDPF